MRVEEREVALTRARLPVQGSRGDGFRRIPLEEIGDRIVRAVQALDAEVFVVDEALVLVGGDRRIDWISNRLDILHAAAHMVELHHEVRRAAGP